MVIGQQKARDAKQQVYRNFGMPQSRGISQGAARDADCREIRTSDLYVCRHDGAHPGMGAEERGQAEAIAHNLREMARLQVPIIAAVIGVGGSGGALAIAVADRVIMMENSVYSVISPEGCASIMWRDPSKKDLAAEAMKITATDLSELGSLMSVIPEPEGGAHTDHEAAAALLDQALQKLLRGAQESAASGNWSKSRYNKFRNDGAVSHRRGSLVSNQVHTAFRLGCLAASSLPFPYNKCFPPLIYRGPARQKPVRAEKEGQGWPPRM